MKKLMKINKKKESKGFLCSLFRGIWGFRKEDRMRNRQSITKSTPGFEKLSTALYVHHFFGRGWGSIVTKITKKMNCWATFGVVVLGQIQKPKNRFGDGTAAGDFGIIDWGTHSAV